VTGRRRAIFKEALRSGREGDRPFKQCVVTVYLVIAFAAEVQAAKGRQVVFDFQVTVEVSGKAVILREDGHPLHVEVTQADVEGRSFTATGQVYVVVMCDPGAEGDVLPVCILEDDRSSRIKWVFH